MRNVWGKIRKNYQNLGKMRKVELLPTRDCEAGYGPAAGSNYPGHLVKKTGVRTLTVLHNHDNREPPFHRQTRSKSWPWQKHWCLPYHLTRRRDTQSWDSEFLYTGNHCYMAIHWSLTPLFEVDYRSSWNKGIEQAYYTATETIQNNTVLEPWKCNLYICRAYIALLMGVRGS